MLVLTWISPALAGEVWPGRVVAVIDGDTITVEQGEGIRVKIRLWGIDCPESDQPWGDRATAFTTEKCLGKTFLPVLGLRQ